MDLDKAFVSSLLSCPDQTAFSRVMMGGFRKERLQGEGRIVLEVVLQHLVDYGSLPSLSVVQGKTGILLDPVTESPEFFAREIQGRSIATGLHSTIENVTKLLRGPSADPWNALAAMSEQIRQVQRESVGSTGLESLPALSRSAYDWYQRVKSGERGILTPWQSLNEGLLGFWPEDFILFVARAKTGKTWCAILLAREAWKQGKKVLFVTTEMSKLAIARRFSAIDLRLAYKQVVRGELGAFEEERWLKACEEYEKDDRWKVIGGDFDYHVGTLWAYVDSFEPDLVVGDGIYLLHTDERSDKKSDRAASVYDELKRGAKRFHIPIVSTTQFNRSSKVGTKDPDLATIAQTDSSGWNADGAFAMTQDDEQKKNKRMFIRPMAVREGAIDDFEVNWDFDTMDFTELVKVTHQQPGAGPTPGTPGASGSAPDPNDPNDPNMTLF